MPRISAIFNNYSILKQIPVFQKLGWLKLQKIARRATLVEYKKGEIIRKQGDPADGFYCLISGRIQAYVLGLDDKKRDVEFIRRGMHFGIISVLTGENHSTSYEAINDSIVLKINKNDFSAILKAIPELGVELSQSLSRRIRSQTTHTKSVFESKVISIYSPVKGTGSSTYSINLALSLHRETKRKVILATISSGSQPVTSDAEGLSEATPHWKRKAINIKDIIDDHDRILHSASTGEIGIDLLNVSFDPKDTSLVHEISHFVSALVNSYDFVVVDLPNDMDEVVLKTLTQSDIVQLVTSDNNEDLKTTKEVIYSLEEAIRENFQQEKVQVIISGRQASEHGSFEEIEDKIDYPIFTKLPHIDRKELHLSVVARDMTVILPAPHSEYAKSVKRIARQIGGVLVGLVLGGGAALGVAHVGVLQVFEEEKIPIDVMVGSSMGALMASFWAVGKNGRELEELAREFKNPWAMLKLLRPALRRGVTGGQGIEHWLGKTLDDKTFYNTHIPLKIVAYDLVRRQELVIDTGSILQAVRKSIAIPGVIEPVLEKDKVIIDGGVLNPLPTNVLVQMGVKRIIAVNVLQSPEHVSKGHDMEQRIQAEKEKIRFAQKPFKFIGYHFGKVLGKIFLPNIADIIVRTLQASEYIIAQESAKYADVIIHPDLEGINWFELYEVERLIQSGREAAKKALPQIRQLIKEQS